jgi:hypothetical protein
LKSENLGAIGDKIAIANQIEWRKSEFGSPQPRCYRDVWPDACRFAECQRERFCQVFPKKFALTVFDHRSFADFLQVGFRFRHKFISEHLVANFPLFRRVNRGRLACAERHHFHPLRRHLRGGQMAGAAPRGTIRTIGRIWYSKLSASCLSPPLT